MFKYAREKIHDLIDELQPLIREHYDEIAAFHDIPLDPAFEQYKEIEENGGLRCYTARLEAKLVGYNIFFLSRNMHYQSSLQATQDVVFLQREYRGNHVGADLIKWSDCSLASEGVQVVYHHVKLAHDFGPLLESQGYRPFETVYAKRLG